MPEKIKIAKDITSLSPLQIDIIEETMRCIPFIKDLTGGCVSVYAPSKSKKSIVSIYGEELKNLPLHQVALIEETFRAGKSFNGWEEDEKGGRGVRSFCIKDANSVIAVIMLSYGLKLPMAEFTHLLHGAEASVSYGRKLDKNVWGKIDEGDGVIIADRFNRVVYADDAARLIYRVLNIGNLLGRNIFDEDLRQAVTKEIRSKKSPWEIEMTVGDKILRERRISFTEGGKSHGHIIIISDITKEKQREEDEKIQAALKTRIAELEEELSEIKNSLAARKLIDRAKGLLMDKYDLTEEESYRKIQRTAMIKRMTIKEVAELILAQNGKSKI